MAFGWELGGEHGKTILTLFRIGVALFGGWYLWKLIREKAHPGLISCGALILAGAFGNIVDSVFYARIFSDSYYSLGVLFPPEGGYGGWLQGKVVDMLYFPIIDTTIPDWFPFWKNEDFVFFRPVFNIADSSITIGLFMIILFYKKFFKEELASEITT